MLMVLGLFFLPNIPSSLGLSDEHLHAIAYRRSSLLAVLEEEGLRGVVYHIVE